MVQFETEIHVFDKQHATMKKAKINFINRVTPKRR